MLYLKVLADGITVTEFASEMPAHPFVWADRPDGDGIGWMNKRDIKSLDQATKLAESMTALTGKLYLGTTDGREWNVLEAPAIGDKVSATFNGDTYPEGEIVKMSKTMFMITTSTGKKFYRKSPTSGAWVSGHQYMIGGHVYEQNPHI